MKLTRAAEISRSAKSGELILLSCSKEIMAIESKLIIATMSSLNDGNFRFSCIVEGIRKEYNCDPGSECAAVDYNNLRFLAVSG